MDDQWKKLSGENDWEGLLEPPSDDLQRRLELYVKGVKAIFHSVKKDKRHPAHEKEDLFFEVLKNDELGKLYTVTNYVYAMSNVVPWANMIVKSQSACIGYVAVATDEGKKMLGRRDILICWRGTLSAAEWLKNCEFDKKSASDIFGDTHDPHVHKGFLSLYMSPNIEPSCNNLSAREQVLNAVKELVNKPCYKDEEISITVIGHSLGGALATLNATDIVANKHNERTRSGKICMVTAFVFGSPKVGDAGFKNVFKELSNLHLLHTRIKRDIVTKLPLSSYKKVGIQFKIWSYRATMKQGLSKFMERLIELEEVSSKLQGDFSELMDKLKRQFRRGGLGSHGLNKYHYAVAE